LTTTETANSTLTATEDTIQTVTIFLNNSN
jgi:hypothetical protein